MQTTLTVRCTIFEYSVVLSRWSIALKMNEAAVAATKPKIHAPRAWAVSLLYRNPSNRKKWIGWVCTVVCMIIVLTINPVCNSRIPVEMKPTLQTGAQLNLNDYIDQLHARISKFTISTLPRIKRAAHFLHTQLVLTDGSRLLPIFPIFILVAILGKWSLSSNSLVLFHFLFPWKETYGWLIDREGCGSITLG